MTQNPLASGRFCRGKVNFQSENYRPRWKEVERARARARARARHPVCEERILEGQSRPAARRVIPKNVYRRIFRISIIYRHARARTRTGRPAVNLPGFLRDQGVIIIGYLVPEKRRGDCTRRTPYILIETLGKCTARETNDVRIFTTKRQSAFLTS